MATRYENMGRSEKRSEAVVVYAYEDGSQVPRGKFLGYIKGNSVKLYPADRVTRWRYKGNALDITIFDLKARCAVCT